MNVKVDTVFMLSEPKDANVITRTSMLGPLYDIIHTH